MSFANKHYKVLTEKEKEKMISEAAKHYAKFMQALGIDIDQDPNSQNTPKRVAKAFVNEICRGRYTNEPNITSFPNNQKEEMYNGLVFQGNIKLQSLCSHHHMAFTGFAHVAYIPGESVVGLSKLNRIVDFYARRPQIQEGLTSQILKHINSVIPGNKGIAVSVEANHTCCSNRGLEHNSTMITNELSGLFLEKDRVREEFFNCINRIKNV